ncbi:glycine zipper 2TM domain-containing protein [Chitinimonas sp.]|uniref:glycine zipper 2TM domain-containing protein n=1 Tax=Chitinimonas sp. TaxID=1934313 RepID=UPI002F94EA7F
MRHTLMLLSAALCLPAFASDALIDAYNADKVKIAEDYKTAIHQCEKGSSKLLAGCKKTATLVRQDALKAASQERDEALKCRDTCGRVVEVGSGEKQGEASAVGTVGGGVVGAVVGRKLAGGASSSTKNVATAAGAVGGALIGRKIEEKVRTHKAWVVTTQLYSGERQQAEFDSDPGLKQGDKVEIRDGKPVRR